MKYFVLFPMFFFVFMLYAQDVPDPAATEYFREVQKVRPGEADQPPADALVLFDGDDLDMWQSAQFGSPATIGEIEELILKMDPDFSGQSAEWQIENGELVVNPGAGDIATKKAFGDIQLHIEWLAPIDEEKEGQAYSNSGIFFMGVYELQVLNSYENETYANGQAGAIYKQHMPLVNATRPPGEWQEYDVIFIAPRFSENGKLINPARITVLHNGVLVQNNTHIWGPTVYRGTTFSTPHPEKLPLKLQDHGDPVRFRNIWVREL